MEQRSPEWLKERQGHCTASRARHAMGLTENGTPKKDGTYSDTREKYMIEVLAERMAGFTPDHFVSEPMRWGIEQEPFARLEYERVNDVLVRQEGFRHHPTIEFLGGSPDGLIVGKKRGVEFKCPQPTTHIKWVKSGVIPDAHKPQMLCLMLCYGYTEWDFVSFDPRMKAGPVLWQRTYTPTDEELKHCESELKKFLEETEAEFQNITEAA